MESIFHEKQEGSLCAQHCLNALLQGEYFTAVDLATFAEQLDEAERARMAEGGSHSEDFQKFLEQPSGNMDDSGYFSIQVLSAALRVWELELIPFNSQCPAALLAQCNPVDQTAFICNFKDHWLTIRKLGYQWFNLNSLLTGPELISDTYLSMLLVQLQQEGYSIFIVNGILPDCEADQLLKVTPAVQTIKPKLLRPVSTGSSDDGQQQIKPDDLAKALELSRAALEDQEAEDLKAAVALSMEGSGLLDAQAPASSSSHPAPFAINAEPEVELSPKSAAADVRRRRQAFLDNLQSSSLASSSGSESGGSTVGAPLSQREPRKVSEMSEDEMLQAAIKLSMETR